MKKNAPIAPRSANCEFISKHTAYTSHQYALCTNYKRTKQYRQQHTDVNNNVHRQCTQYYTYINYDDAKK